MEIVIEYIMQCALCLIGALSFGIQYNIRRHHIFAAAAGAVLSKLLYLILQGYNVGDAKACFFAALSVAVYSEVLARVFRSPVTMYIIVGIIPLVPGTDAYYTMLSLVTGDNEMFLARLIDTFMMSGAIAMGIFTVPALIKLWTAFYNEHKRDIKAHLQSLSEDNEKSIKKI